jgi:hypothetical protein
VFVVLEDDKQMMVKDTLDELMVEKMLFADSENIQKIEK